MPHIGQQIITPSTSNLYIASGYHNGSGYVKGDANLIPANILSGKSIFGVAGSLTPGKRFTTGYVSSGSTQELFYQYNAGGDAVSSPFINLANLGLTFTPRIIMFIMEESPQVVYFADAFISNQKMYKTLIISSAKYYASTYNSNIIAVSYYNRQYVFLAWE